MEDAEELAAAIEAQKRAILEVAKGRKGQKATNKASRREIAFGYASESETRSKPIPPGGHEVRTCFITYAYPPSMNPVQDLKPIKLSELRLETHHTGCVLFVRTFTDSIRLVSIQAGIEDEVGEVDHLALYNGDPALKPAQIMPKDTIFAIKEPFYKASASGGYIVRVDHPSDLVKMPNTHDLVPFGLQPRLIELDKSVETLKLDGNQAYKAKHFLSALDKYTQGLAQCEEEDSQLRADILRNRSIVNLYLRRYEPAAADATASILPGSDLSISATKSNAKAYYRAGCALYHQGGFNEALSRFRHSLDLLPDDADCLREVERTENRLREQDRGYYNFGAISKSASSKYNRLDHASFLANVEVRKSSAKGRGLYAVTDFKAGDLILCEKAFLVSHASDSEAETYTVLNLNTNVGVIGTQATLMFNLAQKMLHNSAAAAKFFDLFDGGYSPKCKAPQVDGVTVVDTFQLAAIREHNAFGCPTVRSTDMPKASDLDSDPRSATGIWITASYINHACDGNAFRSFIGDLMIIRATKDIAKGTEITMPYRVADADHNDTRKALQHGWKFKCDCNLCAVEVRTGGSQQSKRRQLVKEVEAFLTNNRQSATVRPSKADIAKAQKLYTQLETTYDKTLFNGMPRLGLIDLGLWLVSAQPPNANTKNLTDRAIGILRNCGYGVEVKGKELKIDPTHSYMHSGAIDAAVHAAHACYFKGDEVVGKQFQAFAKKLYVTRNGVLVGYVDRYGDGI